MRERAIDIGSFDAGIEQAKRKLTQECLTTLTDLSTNKAEGKLVIEHQLGRRVPKSLFPSYDRPFFRIYTYENGELSAYEYLGYRNQNEKNRLKGAKPREIKPEEVPFAELPLTQLRNVAMRLKTVRRPPLT